MGVAITLKQYLNLHGDRRKDLHGNSLKISRKMAMKAHVPPEKIARCVMLEDERGYVLAICPITHRVRLGRLCRNINRHLHFASEQELIEMQSDDMLGAASSIGEVHDVEVVIDDELLDKPDIYFEVSHNVGSDMELDMDFMHVQKDDLQHLMQNAEHAAFSQPITKSH